MGGGMSKILPGLYVGNFRDAKDPKQLSENNITHILSIHDNAKKLLEDIEYLIIIASDSPSENLVRFFPECIDFIHKARLSGGGVLVHCLAGVSRSVTVTAAYLMTAANMNWRDALNAIRGARNHANPNFGFQKQLQTYETEGLEMARQKFKETYPENKFNDEAEGRQLIQAYNHYVLTGESPPSSSSTRPPPPPKDGLYPLPPKAYATKRYFTYDLTQDSTSGEKPPAVSEPDETEAQACGSLDVCGGSAGVQITVPQSGDSPSGIQITVPQSGDPPSGVQITVPQSVNSPSGVQITVPHSVDPPSGVQITVPQSVDSPSGVQITVPHGVDPPSCVVVSNVDGSREEAATSESAALK
ncbi:hypothetical protein ACOMHN_032149 [Nucella lapillus]